MKYNCRRITINKLLTDYEGISEPLCQHCTNIECENPIQIREVFVVGVLHKMKLYAVGEEPMAVTQCEGFVND
jgi:hypothetical protein